jgi:hypothetical protein
LAAAVIEPASMTARNASICLRFIERNPYHPCMDSYFILIGRYALRRTK